jgi:hypothetical protein
MDASVLVINRMSHQVSMADLRATILQIRANASDLGVSEEVVAHALHTLELRRQNDIAVSEGNQTDRQVYDIGTILDSMASTLASIQKLLVRPPAA